MKSNLISVAASAITASTLFMSVFIALPAYAQASGDSDITARLASLNQLSARIQSMKNVSTTVKANLATTIQTNVTGLTALKSKIDGETDIPTLRADVSSIFTVYRIYALVIPQGYILAASDRVATIDGLMTTFSTKLQARITADQTAGKDVSALQTALTDMNAKIADAGTQAQTAQNGVSSLAPDKGNASVAASNNAALLAARAGIKTATADLKTARQDITTIVTGLKTLH